MEVVLSTVLLGVATAILEGSALHFPRGYIAATTGVCI